MKALQLDVGFVHEYMSVAYKLIDEHHAEFWLNHCGALLDAEPFGELPLAFVPNERADEQSPEGMVDYRGDFDPGVAAVLALQPDLPPGFDRDVSVDGDRVRLILTASVPGLLDPEHPGSPGLLARGERSGLEAMAHGVHRRARLETVEVDGGRVVAEWVVEQGSVPAAEPDEVALIRMSLASTWAFEGVDAPG